MAKIDEQELIQRIRTQLEQEPAVEDPMQIDLVVERRGALLNRRTVVNVSGRIKDETEGRKIEDAIRTSVAGLDNVDVENNLVVPLI
ncbi:MAG: hypothetical protein EA427_11865 [Spirochaetaceae bacterium]|nr:MAG: hypothetical protein EA427_11865 [Spirochaetaceae bacterium]